MAARNGKRAFFWHPLLLGMYSAVALLSANIRQLSAVYGVRPILASLLFSALVYGVCALAVRKREKAALIASLGLLLFFTYGHVYGLLEGAALWGVVIGRHLVLMTLWVAVLGLGVFLILRARSSLGGLNRVLNIASIVLLLIPLAQLSLFALQTGSSKTATMSAATPVADGAAGLSAGTDAPDVYYIILDTYARDDMLQKYYKLDNTEFITRLQNLGFYVAPCSLSNYSYTPSSLASALNMDYLEEFAGEIIAGNRSFYDLGDSIKHSRVRRLFESLGYQTITAETGIWWLEITDSDRFITTTGNPWARAFNPGQITNFELYFLRTTAVRPLDEAGKVLSQRLGKRILTPERAHYDSVTYILDELEHIPSIPGRKFVYIHLIAPHFPYVFSPDGDFEYSFGNSPGYTNEILYLNARFIPLLEEIIQNSAHPPVIILQGDHGMKSEARNAILNAYYLPGASSGVYAAITPVNSFRTVFNVYFDGQFPLLADYAYSSTYDQPYQFDPVVDICNPERLVDSGAPIP